MTGKKGFARIKRSIRHLRAIDESASLSMWLFFLEVAEAEDHSPPGLRPSDMIEILGIATSGPRRLADLLGDGHGPGKKKGLGLIEEVAVDRRSHRFRLTARGRDLVRELDRLAGK